MSKRPSEDEETIALETIVPFKQAKSSDDYNDHDEGDAEGRDILENIETAAEFRKLLTEEATVRQALQTLFGTTSEANAEREIYIKEYFEAGGNCFELFKIFEFHSERPETIIIICTRLILAIVESHPTLQATTLEACRYMLNTHLELINKMLNVSSSSKERWAILRMLTAMITLSTSLVKTILLNVRFHTKLLIRFEKNIKNSVRIAFINFVMSFFVDGDTRCVLQLLEHPYLIHSIIPGLRFDPAPTVLMVLMTIKKHVIDKVIPKDKRIKMFNVSVIKGLVFLYDWRGPLCFEEERQRQVDGYTDERNQAEIAEDVHAILLVLCTSIKNGVIFRDNTLGTGNIHRNPLMYNIVDMSFRDNQIGGLHQELIVRMAVELPDMVKTVWSRLLSLLEPRIGGPWLDAMKMVRDLISNIKPETSVHYASKLSPLQYAQVIQTLVTPGLILDTIILPKFVYPMINLKHEVTQTIVVILQAVRKFLAQSKAILPVNYYRTLRRLLQEHLQRTLPNAVHFMYTEEEQKAEIAKMTEEYIDYMCDVVMIIEQYHVMCPALLETLRFNHLAIVLKINLNDALDKLHYKLRTKERRLKIAVVNSLHGLDPVQFAIGSAALMDALKMLASYLRLDENSASLIDSACHHSAVECICKLLNGTGIFGECMYEAEIWTDYLRYPEMRTIFFHVLSEAHTKSGSVQKTLSELRMTLNEESASLPIEGISDSAESILSRLCSDSYTKSTIVKPMKVNTISTIVVLAMREKFNHESSKHLAQIFIAIFHLQTDYRLFQALVKRYSANLLPRSSTYIMNFFDDTSFFRWDKLPNCPVYTVAAVVFKITNAVVSNTSVSHMVNLVKKNAPFVLDLIYCNPNVFRLFQPWNEDPICLKCTQFITCLTVGLKTMGDDDVTDVSSDLDPYLKPYQRRLYNCILHPNYEVQIKDEEQASRGKFFKDVVNAFGMTYDECMDIIETLSKKPYTHFITEDKKANHNCHTLVLVMEYFFTISENLPPDNERRLPIVLQLLNLCTELNRNDFNIGELSRCAAKFVTNFDLNLLSQEEILREYVDSIFQVGYFHPDIAAITLRMYSTINISESVLHDAFKRNLSYLERKKGYYLPLLDMMDLNDELAAMTYETLSSNLDYLLSRPEKDKQQHCTRNYKGLAALIYRQADLTLARSYLETVQRPLVNEVFYAAILKALYLKYFQSAAAKTDKDINKLSQNAVLTFVHYIVSMFKVLQKKTSDEEGLDENAFGKIEEVCQYFQEIVAELARTVSFKVLRENETVQLFCKLCLKFGIGNKQGCLMNMLLILVKTIKFTLTTSKELLDMLMSHSEFMNLTMGESNAAKLAVFECIYGICKIQPELMERKHVPVLLAAYTATIHPADRRILSLLYMYEDHREQTMIYDFKPFLWGQAAGNFYTLRPEDRRGLSKQPRTRDILDIIQPAMIEYTIVNFPRTANLSWHPLDMELPEADSAKMYDVGFILSVLTQILSNEYILLTHKITRSGVMALVAIAFSSHHVFLRKAACHVLAKFYYHLEGQRFGKDHPLWMRYVEVLAKGVGATDKQKLNGFASLFMARTAIAISNPTDPMYKALSNFIGVKVAPDLSRIPELSFMFSSDVYYLTYRHFILQILHDGMQSYEDYDMALRANALKIMMELFNSSICDGTSKELILKIIERIVVIPQACLSFCQMSGLSTWLYNIALTHSDSLLLQRVVNIYNIAVKQKGVQTIMAPVGMITAKILPMLERHSDD